MAISCNISCPKLLLHMYASVYAEKNIKTWTNSSLSKFTVGQEIESDGDALQPAFIADIGSGRLIVCWVDWLMYWLCSHGKPMADWSQLQGCKIFGFHIYNIVIQWAKLTNSNRLGFFFFFFCLLKFSRNTREFSEAPERIRWTLRNLL